MATTHTLHRLGAFLTALALAAVPAAASASTINCGDTLTAGSWLLEADLVCPYNSPVPGVTLASGADLDLGGHSIGMSIAGAGTAVEIAGTGASLHGGTVTSASIAVHVTGGGGSRIHDVQVTDSNDGFVLENTSGNSITSSQVNGMAVYGVYLNGASKNRLDQLTVNDTSGIGPAAGIFLIGSNDNSITRSQVLRSQCTGVFVRDSSRNVICFNQVQDSYSFLKGPSVDILLRDASSNNLVCRNQVSATASPAVTFDGINVGCKDGCHCGLGGAGFSTPSTGATGNLVLGNVADGEARYGIAQAHGNPGNLYLLDQATGNGVANFAIDP